MAAQGVARRGAVELKHAVLEFWFGANWRDLSKYHTFSSQQKLWWVGNPQVDEEIREKFGEAIERAAQHEYDSELRNDPTAEGDLALVLLFDQFSRNVFRGQATAFAFDGLAREVARKVVCVKDGEQRRDKGLPYLMRYFFAVPFMHEESVSGQDTCMEVTNAIKSELNIVKSKEKIPMIEAFNKSLEFAKDHKKIIEQFGRFPHRNECLGRDSTDEEKEYLKTAERFGQ